MANNNSARRGVTIYIDGTPVRNSVRGIQREMRKLVNEQANMTRGSDEYIAHARKIAQLQRLLDDHRDTQREIAREFSNMGDAADEFGEKADKAFSFKDKLKDLKGAIVGVFASIILDKAVGEFAKLDDKYADVMKTTGQTREEVAAMNEEFSKIDTRTGRIELNDMAEEAGRIGIAKDEVLDFVKAMDVANVALGDSFSGGASEIANTLGKLKFLFKDTQSLGVEKAYLSIASAINELGANGVASEVNIANFTTRIGSLPDSLKPSISDTLALGAAFEESGVEAEVASRAYSIFLQKASTDTAGFGKIMGKSKEYVEELINTNPVQFFLDFSESMKGMSATDVSKTLKDLKIGADGVNKVLGAAASNTDRFRELIDLSNKSFEEGTSVMNEFNIKNNTLGADLDKGKKVLQDYIYELGERLAPYVKEGIGLGTSAIKVLSVITGFLFENKTAILAVVAAIITYTSAIKLAALWTSRWSIIQTAHYRLLQLSNGLMIVLKGTLYALQVAYFTLTGQVSKARGAMLAFAAVTGYTNPLALLTGVVLALAAAFVIFKKSSSDVSQLQKSQQAITKKTNEEYDRQRSRIDVLVDTLHNEQIALGNRRKALEELKTIIPGYHADLTDEGILINDNTDAIKNYLVQLEKQIRLKAAQDELEELYRKKRQQERTVAEKQARADRASEAANVITPGGSFSSGASGLAASQAQSFANTAKKELENTQKAIEGIRNEIQEAQKEFLEPIPTVTTTNENTVDGGDKTTDKATKQRQKVQDALKKLEIDNLNELSRLRENYRKGYLEDEAEYNKALLIQQDAYDKLRKDKLQGLLETVTDPSLRIDISKQIADIDAKAYDRQISDMEKRRKELAKWNDEETKKIVQASLKEVDQQEAKAEQLLAMQRAKNEISEVEYRSRLLENEKKFLEERLRINGLTEEEIAKIRQEMERNPQEQAINKAEARTSALDKYGLVSLQSQKEQELALIKYYEDQGILTHDEAIKARMEADQVYLDGLAGKVSEVNEKVQTVSGNLTGTMTNFASAEESAVSRKYDKQIAAAEGNSKKQKKLEEQKQKELNAIRAKYADKQFAVTTAMTIASTAQAAMEAYKAMAGIPVVGPALGALAAGAAIAYGSSQIAMAKEQRDAAKEGYFDGGFTGGTDPKAVRAYLPNGEPVHGMEFVANRHSTANGMLRPLFDVIDEAQRHNTVSSLTKADLAKALNIPTGYYQGGYNGPVASSPTLVRDSRYNEAYERFADVLERLEEKMDMPFRGYVTYKGDDGIEEAQNLDEKMKKNASR